MLASDIKAGIIRWSTNTSAAMLGPRPRRRRRPRKPELLQLYGGPDANDPDAVRQFAQELATTIINGIARPTQSSASRNRAERP